MKHAEVTDKIIACFFTVYRALGYGFLESVYQRALAIELSQQGLIVQCQYPIKVYYQGEVVGEFVADMVVASCVVVELKAASALAPEHHAQLLNYLNATDYEVGLLLNFGPKPDFKRKVFDNERKHYQSPRHLE